MMDTFLFGIYIWSFQGFPGGSVVKYLPAMQELQETWVRSLGQEDTLEEGTVTHSSILAWRITWTEGTWQATVCRVANSWTGLKRHSSQACMHGASKIVT